MTVRKLKLESAHYRLTVAPTHAIIRLLLFIRCTRALTVYAETQIFILYLPARSDAWRKRFRAGKRFAHRLAA